MKRLQRANSGHSNRSFSTEGITQLESFVEVFHRIPTKKYPAYDRLNLNFCLTALGSGLFNIWYQQR